jgi:hypothetical protein
MKISEAFPSKFLKADDLSGKIAVTINDVGQEAMGMDKTLKLILYFRELDKPMVCNHTNGDMIAQLHGDETDNWRGKRIVLTRALVPFQGKNVPAVRVCDFIPGQKKAAPPPPEEPVGELDFVEADQAMADL